MMYANKRGIDMKLKVVDGYMDESFERITREDLIGKSFRGFSSVIQALHPKETVTVEGEMGYKQVGVMENGEGWIQRFWAPGPSPRTTSSAWG
jgi:hypothetical protein